MLHWIRLCHVPLWSRHSWPQIQIINVSVHPENWVSSTRISFSTQKTTVQPFFLNNFVFRKQSASQELQFPLKSIQLGHHSRVIEGVLAGALCLEKCSLSLKAAAPLIAKWEKQEKTCFPTNFAIVFYYIRGENRWHKLGKKVPAVLLLCNALFKAGLSKRKKQGHENRKGHYVLSKWFGEKIKLGLVNSRSIWCQWGGFYRNGWQLFNVISEIILFDKVALTCKKCDSTPIPSTFRIVQAKSCLQNDGFLSL